MQPLIEPMLVPSKTRIVWTEVDPCVEFMKEFMAVMDWKNTKLFGDLQHVKLQLMFRYCKGPSLIRGAG